MNATTRPSRADQTRRERRMKPGDVVQTGIKLAVDETRLDPSKTYRWVNDVPGRIDQFKKRDWDLVDDEEIKTDGTGMGSVPTQHGGIGENGKPFGMVLMSKFKDWHESDQKAKRAPLADMDKAIARGTAHQQSGEAELSGDVTYTPGTNSIEVRNSR